MLLFIFDFPWMHVNGSLNLLLELRAKMLH